MKLDSITNITVSFIHLNLKETLLKGLIQLFMYVFGVRDRFWWNMMWGTSTIQVLCVHFKGHIWVINGFLGVSHQVFVQQRNVLTESCMYP